MNKVIVTIVCASVLSLQGVVPALANGDGEGLLTKRVPSWIVGTIGGMPFSIARRIGSEVKENAEAIKDRPLLAIPGVAIGLPMSIAGGFFDGIVYSSNTAWEYSADQPFSKETFSRGEMIEY